ncbi:MAG: hypothetical protein HQL12_00010 [Candidatus Omnitrophica bacterium]|nr:hypothetical protein [Candidatus Omnitrophota bacterium]
MINRIRLIIVFIFLLFNPPSFAQTGVNCTQIQCVKILEGKLLVFSFDQGTYKPFFIKGVGYQPTPIARHPSDWGWLDDDPRSNNIYDDSSILNRDFAKLRLMNANTIRLWKGNDTQEANRFPNKLTVRTLILAAKYHLKIIAGFWVNGLTFDSQNNINDRQETISRFVEYVNNFKRYSAILFWAIGNENNYNKIDGHLMTPEQLTAWYALVNDMAQAAHDAEGSNFHPVAVVNGEIEHIGDAAYGAADEQMPAVDIWGANVYRGRSFYTLFSDYKKKSQKPLWVSEFGTDAWHVKDINNPDNGYEDQNTQSDWIGSLWDEIVQNVPITIGGTVMEYSDEWWKPSEWRCTDSNLSQEENAKLVKRCISTHYHVGHPDNGYPDRFSTEAWFGIMSIARNSRLPHGPDIMKERKVYFTLQKKWQLNPY